MDSPQAPNALNRKALIFIIITIVLNTLGLTLVAPVAPYLVARYVSDPGSIGVAVGWLGSTYAICQFIAAPGLGALSDRFGRRPILLLCLLGSVFGYMLLGFGGALWVLFLGRAIDGITGANTSIMIAYIADIVPESQRSKYFGWIGAIGAASIVLGPAAGGLMAKFGYNVPFYVAGFVSLATLVMGFFFMPESLAKTKRATSITLAKLNPFTTLKTVFMLPQLRWLLIALFLYTLSTVMIPSNIGLFARDQLNWDADSTGALFSVFGVVTILVQGVLLQWLIKRYRTAQITLGGLVFTIIAFVVIALVAGVSAPILLYGGVILFALGDGLTSPTLLELITGATDVRSQGQVQGGSQSVQSLANIAGPLLAGFFYDHLGHASPYLSGAGVVALAFGAMLLAVPLLRKPTSPPNPLSTSGEGEQDRADDSVKA
jgi:DHA1 family tetracycline resistance protein-like MFS transporter